MKGFLYAQTQLDVLPDTVLLYNGGAKLSAEGSQSVEDLRSLEAQGVEILTCGTCLNFTAFPRSWRLEMSPTCTISPRAVRGQLRDPAIMQKKNREETVVHTFQPVYDENSRVLMLGTMPSPKNPGNRGFTTVIRAIVSGRSWRIF